MPLLWMSRVINVGHLWILRVVDYGNSRSDGNSFVGIADSALSSAGSVTNRERVTDVIVVFFAQFLSNGALR